MMRCLVEKYRVSGESDWGPVGAFAIPAGMRRPLAIYVIASGGDGWEDLGYPLPAWEHVSVSTKVRCPTWEEMNYVKDLFWEPEDCVIQFHPPQSDYVNCHPFVLHLWRPIGVVLPRPPSETVGPKWGLQARQHFPAVAGVDGD